MTQKEHNHERSVDERESDQEGIEKDICPECQSQITQEGSQGEAICVNCGLVYEEDQIDYGPEWRAFRQNERDKKKSDRFSDHSINARQRTEYDYWLAR